MGSDGPAKRVRALFVDFRPSDAGAQLGARSKTAGFFAPLCGILPASALTSCLDPYPGQDSEALSLFLRFFRLFGIGVARNLAPKRD